MSWKKFGVVAALALVASGCSNSTDESADVPADDTSVEQPAADAPPEAESPEENEPAIPKLLDATAKRALSANDLGESVVDGRLNIDGRGLHIELPGTFTRAKDIRPSHIAMWNSPDHQQSVVLSVAGIAGVVPDGEAYVADLQKSSFAAGYDIEYAGDVEFGEASAKVFHLSAPGRVVEIFAFEYDGISYELTLRASDQAGMDNVHGFALATVVTNEKSAEPTTDDTGDAHNTPGDDDVSDNAADNQ